MDSTNFDKPLQNILKETSFLKSVFVGSEILDCRVIALEKKDQFRKTSPGPGLKMFRKKLQGQDGYNLFINMG